MRLITSIFAISEILLFCLGGISFIYRPKMNVCEALSSGIVLVFIFISCIFQVAFLVGQPNLSFFLEAFALIILYCFFQKKQCLIKEFSRKIQKSFGTFWVKNRIISLVLLFSWAYLGLQAILLPPANWDSMTYNLARVLLFQQENSFYLKSFTTLRQAIFPVGSDILHHVFLRFYNDYGIGLFSFLAYLAVILGTYALSRKYTSSEIALMSTLVIGSLPELVYQSTSTKNDIMMVAVAIFCFLTIKRLLENLNGFDICLLLLGLCFGISVKTNFIAFAIPFALFFSILLFIKYPARDFLRLFDANKLVFLIFLPPVLILSQIWLFIQNYNRWNNWAGPEEYLEVFQQNHGLKGAVANLIRYLFESIHLLPLENIILQEIFKFSLKDSLQRTYDLLFSPVIGSVGIHNNYSFRIDWIANEDFSWFGLWGWLLIIPGIIYCAVFARKFVRAVSFTLLSYLFIVSYKIVWMPWNNRFMSLFFASSGICIAYFIKSLKVKKEFIIKIINYSCCLSLVIALILNNNKQLINSPNQLSDLIPINWGQNILENSIWSETNLGKDRLFYAKNQYGDERVDQFTKLVPPGAKVGLIAGDDSWIYHYLLFNPKNKFTPLRLSSLNDQEPKFDYLLCLDIACDLNQTGLTKAKIVWSSQKSAKEGKLIEIN